MEKKDIEEYAKKPVAKVFPEGLENIKKGLCPFCNKEINPETEFKNEKCKKEFLISGLCQNCQDDFFGK